MTAVINKNDFWCEILRIQLGHIALIIEFVFVG